MRVDPILLAVSQGLDAIEAQVIGITSGHCRRIAAICNGMGSALGMSHDERITLSVSALLHDSALTEWIMSGDEAAEHCIMGQHNLDTLPLPTDATDFVKYHHERADGSGMFGMKDIPLCAEIISVADAFDAGIPLGGFSPKLIEAVHVQYSNEPLPEWHLHGRDAMKLGDIIARVIDYKSKFTRRHTLGIAEKARTMADFYRYDEETTAKLYLAACLHDVGKLFTPTEILEKPERLTNDEFITIKNHVYKTHEMLEGIDPDIRSWAAGHHEKLNGMGYPFGLDGDKLDFNSRLLACVDIYQAVSEERPYHPARSHKDTIEILSNMANNGFIDINITRDIDMALEGVYDRSAKSYSGNGIRAKASHGRRYLCRGEKRNSQRVARNGIPKPRSIYRKRTTAQNTAKQCAGHI